MRTISKFRKRRQDKHQRRAARLAQMRAAKALKRQALIDAGWTPEPKMLPYHRFEYGVRDKMTGETHFRDLVSARQASKALGLILKFAL